MGRKQETLLFAVDSKLPRGTGASKTLKKVGSLWRRLAEPSHKARYLPVLVCRCVTSCDEV